MTGNIIGIEYWYYCIDIRWTNEVGYFRQSETDLC